MLLGEWCWLCLWWAIRSVNHSRLLPVSVMIYWPLSPNWRWFGYPLGHGSGFAANNTFSDGVPVKKIPFFSFAGLGRAGVGRWITFLHSL